MGVRGQSAGGRDGCDGRDGLSLESRAVQPNKDRPAGDRNEMGRG